MIRFYHDMDLLKKYLLPASLLLLVIALLICNRLGFTFAGVTGFEVPMQLGVHAGSGSAFISKNGVLEELVPGTRVPRGSIMETGASSELELYTDWIGLWLSENTKVEVRVLNETSVEFFLVKGRIIVSNSYPPKRPVTISTNYTSSTFLKSVVSFVNYDFLQRVSVLPMTGSVTTSIDGAEPFEIYTPTDISEAAPFAATPVTFDPLLSSAKDFYEWYFDQIELSNIFSASP